MKDRTILWIFLAFILGFGLPVCSCAGTGFLTLSMLNSMAGQAAPTSIGTGDAVAVMRLDGTISDSTGDYLSTGGITHTG